jgi:hypothetical protein
MSAFIRIVRCRVRPVEWNCSSTALCGADKQQTALCGADKGNICLFIILLYSTLKPVPTLPR